MANQTLQLTDAVYNYILSVSVRESPILKRLRAKTAELFADSAEMQISPEQGQFMALLVDIMQAKKTLEIGVFTGYSALAVALALPKEGRIVACDINQSWTDVAKTFWREAGVSEKINLHLAPAMETLDALIASGQTNTFDFAFIDADKKNYEHYYERTLKLLRPGGLMAIDNVLQGGRVADLDNQSENAKAIRSFNQKVYEDKRVNISIIPMSDGITLARKN